MGLHGTVACYVGWCDSAVFGVMWLGAARGGRLGCFVVRFGGWYCGVLCGRCGAVPRGVVGRYAIVGGLWCRVAGLWCRVADRGVGNLALVA